MDPMMAMMLAQGLQGFADNLGAARRGVAPPQQAGVQDMVPMMSMMQRNQMAQQAMAEKQRQDQEQQKLLQDAVPGISEKTGLPPEVVMASLMGGQGDNPLFKAIGNNAENYSLGNVRYSGTDNAPIARSYDRSEFGAFDPLTGQQTVDPAVLAAKAAAARAGATRISNPVTITQDTLSAKLTETPAEMFKKMAERAESAQSALDASRSIYELAKLNPDLIGPGMNWTAEGSRLLEAARKAVAGGDASPDQQRLLSVAQAMDIRQAKSAITTLRDFGGNDTEKELARSIKNTPGIETSLPAHELIYIQEKTAADYLNNMVGYVADYLDKAQRDGSIGIPTVEKAKREYMRQNPLGDQLSANLKAVMEANGMKTTGGAGAASKPDPAGIR